MNSSARIQLLILAGLVAAAPVLVAKEVGVVGFESTATAEPPGKSVQEVQPFYSTFSICAVDPETGKSGAAVTTRVPFVGRAVPWVRAGVGAVCTQAWTVVEYGQRGLDLLAAGVSPADALEQLLADDAGRESRQVGIIDMQGRSAAHSGEKNGDWAGSRQGLDYTVQANIMVGPEVVDAVAEHLNSTAGTGMPLAERMILALEAGQATGGDKRWGRLQSAAIRIADPDNPGRGGDHLSVSIDVGEHPHPVEELKRIYYKTQGSLGHREFSQIAGDDVVELKRMLHALGYWRAELEDFPTAPEFDADRGLMRTDPDAFQAKIAEYRKLAREFSDAYGTYDEEAMAAVETFRTKNGLGYGGNARGLVDARFVAALKDAYYNRPR